MKNRRLTLTICVLFCAILSFPSCGTGGLDSDTEERAALIEIRDNAIESIESDSKATTIPTEEPVDRFVMQDTPDSSCFSEVGYNAATQTLRVCFRTTGYYRYSNFSQSDYNNFLAADSLGTYFNKNIKGFYPYEKEQ